MEKENCSLLGVRLPTLTRAEVLARCAAFLDGKVCAHVATVNAEFLVEAHRNDAFRELLNSTELSVVDGFGPVLLSRLTGGPTLHRFPGVELTTAIAALAEEKGRTVFLYGGFGSVPNEAAAALRERFPRVQIVGAESDDTVALQRIIETHPDILFVALGHPRQEFWIQQHKNEFPSVRLAMGVGGTFDFLAGKARRAPTAFQRMGLESLWRLLVEPWRWKRVFRALVTFPILVLRERR